MTREQEINEFAILVNSLCTKYNVSLGIQILDLATKDKKMQDEQQTEETKVETPTEQVEPVTEPTVEPEKIA